MSDLAEFLLARINEDEQRAHAASAVPEGDVLLAALPDALFEGLRVAFPVRVLAECQSKRHLVRYAQSVLASIWDDDNPEQIARDMLRILAAPYSDHPDFRGEWRVR